MSTKTLNMKMENEKIKAGDWYIDDCNNVRQAVTSDEDYWSVRPDYKKVDVEMFDYTSAPKSDNPL